jgi:hypothetical protein
VRFEVEFLLGVGPARPSYVLSRIVLPISDRGEFMVSTIVSSLQRVRVAEML